MSRIMKADRKQQELLQQFFKEETTWCPEHVGYHIAAVILISISMILCIMPYQAWDLPKDSSVCFSWTMLYLMGVTFYMQKYNNYKEGTKTKAVYDLLRYLPVSHRQFQIYTMKKIVKLCSLATAIAVCCQTVFALAFMHTISIGNILLPLAVNFILPVLYIGILTTIQTIRV